MVDYCDFQAYGPGLSSRLADLANDSKFMYLQCICYMYTCDDQTLACLINQVKRSTLVTTATGFISPLCTGPPPPSSLSVTTAALFHSKNRLRACSGVSNVISINLLPFLASLLAAPTASPSGLRSPTVPNPVTTSLVLPNSNMSFFTSVSALARPWLIQLRQFPSVMRPISLRPGWGERTGS